MYIKRLKQPHGKNTMQTNTIWTERNERELRELKDKLALPKYSDVLRYAVHFTWENFLPKKIDISIEKIDTPVPTSK